MSATSPTNPGRPAARLLARVGNGGKHQVPAFSPLSPQRRLRGPTEMPSWAPGERPGAEAHVGTPVGQGQSCPLLCVDGLQGTAKQEVVV